VRSTRVFGAVLGCWLLVGCGLAVSTEERMERAASALSKGDTRSAVLEARRVLQSQPDHGRARLLLATALFRNGDVDGAADEYRRAAELGVTEPSLEQQLLLTQGRFAELLALLDASPSQSFENALLRATALTGTRDYDGALAVLGDLRRSNPTNVAVGNAVARVYLARGDLDTALAELEAMESYAAEELAYWRMRGPALLAAGRYEQAAAALERADQLGSAGARNADDPLLLAALVQAKLGTGDIEGASPYAERLTQVAPDAPGTLMVSALVAAAKGEDATAAAALQRLLADDPQNAQAAFLLGRLQLRQGRFGQALAQFRSVLARYPDHQGARKLAAATQMRLDQPADALSTLDPLLSDGATDPELYELAGRANLMLGNNAEASALYSRSAGQLEGEPGRVLALAASLLASGDYAGALRLLEKVPDDSTHARERMRIAVHLQSGNRGAAEKALSELLAAHPRDTAAMNVASQGYRQLGELNRAELLLREAVRLDSRSVASYSNLITLLLARGDTAGARSLADALTREESAFSGAERLEVLNLIAAAGDPEFAAERLGQLPLDEPAAFRARLSGAHRLANRGLPALSADLIEELPANITPQDQAAVASVALSLGQAERALALFTLAADAAADSLEMRIGQAQAQLDLGQRQFARGTLQTLVAENPDYVPALVLLARVQQLDGDSAAATATVRSVREIEPRGPIADVLSGDVLVEQKDYAGAARAYRSAVEKAPSRLWAVKSFQAAVAGKLDRPTDVLEDWLIGNDRDVAVREMLAQHYLTERDDARARANYEKLLEIDGGNAGYANNLAWLHIDTNPNRALELAQRAYDAQPDSPAIADTLGWILVKAGRSADAVPLLRRAATMDNAEIRYHLAVSLAETNGAAEARTLFEQVLKSNVRPEILQDTQAWLERL
jgi:putative PEP-CTERM system TPR-repeat lipoprotein